MPKNFSSLAVAGFLVNKSPNTILQYKLETKEIRMNLQSMKCWLENNNSIIYERSKFYGLCSLETIISLISELFLKISKHFSFFYLMRVFSVSLIWFDSGYAPLWPVSYYISNYMLLWRELTLILIPESASAWSLSESDPPASSLDLYPFLSPSLVLAVVLLEF